MEELIESSIEVMNIDESEESKESKEESNSENVQEESSREEIEAVLPPQKTNLIKFRQIINEHLNGETVDAPDGVTQSVLTSYTLAGFLDHAVPLSKDVIITKLHRDCCTSLLDLLRISEGMCFIHEKMVSAIVHLIKMQLLKHYPKYSTQGYEALYSCPPTIYLSTLCIPTLGNQICRKLGLPSSSVKVMKMSECDLSKLENSLQEDLAAKRVPVMIVASVGSHHTGEVDNLTKVTQLSQRFKTWLHLEGHLISQLGLLENVSPSIQIADSLHLDLRQWLGIPSLPFVTMYRHCETALQRAACLTPAACSPFTVVPLWFALQGCEMETINSRFRNALELTTALVEHLSKFQNIKILSHTPKRSKYLAGEVKSDEALETEEDDVQIESKSEKISEGVTATHVDDTAMEKIDEKIDANNETVHEITEKEEATEDNNVESEEKDVDDDKKDIDDDKKDVDDDKKGVDVDEDVVGIDKTVIETEKDDVKGETIDTSVKEVDTLDANEDDSTIISDGADLKESLSTSEELEIEKAENCTTEGKELTLENEDDKEESDETVEAVPEQAEKENDDEKTKTRALMETVCPVVVFQYRPKTKRNEEFSTCLLDDLNLWLVQVLERASDVVHIDIIDADPCGYALRFSPYDCKTFPIMEQLLQFFDCFSQQMEILNATVEHKGTLVQVVESSEELQLVELPGWAGLGGVRYLPAAWRSTRVDQLPDQGKHDVNRINRELVARLKVTDSAFSIGKSKYLIYYICKND